MRHSTRIDTDQRNGNLHINLGGRFTPDIAVQLTLVMTKTYQGRGNIFIHTDKITEVTAESRYAFTNLLEMSGLPGDSIYLTGKNGFDICHDSAKVIVRKEKKHGHGSCGRCKNCQCHKKKAA